MKSIKELYRIGTGPSSSHTMGPRKAAEMFLERHPDTCTPSINKLLFPTIVRPLAAVPRLIAFPYTIFSAQLS